MKYYVTWIPGTDYDRHRNYYCGSKKAAEKYAQNYDNAEILGPFYLKMTAANVLQLVNNEADGYMSYPFTPPPLIRARVR